MSAVLWMNIPLMVLALGLMTGIPLWLVLGRRDWHHKPETLMVPAYLAPRPVPARAGAVRVSRSNRYASHRLMRPATGGASS